MCPHFAIVTQYRVIRIPSVFGEYKVFPLTGTFQIFAFCVCIRVSEAMVRRRDPIDRVPGGEGWHACKGRFLEESRWERPRSRRGGGGVERGGDACIALGGST